jgi:prevent-host-death family protein
VSITTMTSRQFNQDTSRAKKAAKKGPVFITDRGRPAHVLLSIDDYKAMRRRKKNILELLAMPEVAEIDFEPPRLGDEIVRPADFS